MTTNSPNINTDTNVTPERESAIMERALFFVRYFVRHAAEGSRNAEDIDAQRDEQAAQAIAVRVIALVAPRFSALLVNDWLDEKAAELWAEIQGDARQ